MSVVDSFNWIDSALTLDEFILHKVITTIIILLQP